MDVNVKSLETGDLIELYRSVQDFLDFLEKEIKMSEVSE